MKMRGMLCGWLLATVFVVLGAASWGQGQESDRCSFEKIYDLIEVDDWCKEWGTLTAEQVAQAIQANRLVCEWLGEDKKYLYNGEEKRVEVKFNLTSQSRIFWGVFDVKQVERKGVLEFNFIYSCQVSKTPGLVYQKWNVDTAFDATLQYLLDNSNIAARAFNYYYTNVYLASCPTCVYSKFDFVDLLTVAQKNQWKTTGGWVQTTLDLWQTAIFTAFAPGDLAVTIFSTPDAIDLAQKYLYSKATGTSDTSKRPPSTMQFAFSVLQIFTAVKAVGGNIPDLVNLEVKQNLPPLLDDAKRLVGNLDLLPVDIEDFNQAQTLVTTAAERGRKSFKSDYDFVAALLVKYNPYDLPMKTTKGTYRLGGEIGGSIQAAAYVNRDLMSEAYQRGIVGRPAQQWTTSIKDILPHQLDNYLKEKIRPSSSANSRTILVDPVAFDQSGKLPETFTLYNFIETFRYQDAFDLEPVSMLFAAVDTSRALTSLRAQAEPLVNTTKDQADKISIALRRSEVLRDLSRHWGEYLGWDSGARTVAEIKTGAGRSLGELKLALWEGLKTAELKGVPKEMLFGGRADFREKLRTKVVNGRSSVWIGDVLEATNIHAQRYSVMNFRSFLRNLNCLLNVGGMSPAVIKKLESTPGGASALVKALQYMPETFHATIMFVKNSGQVRESRRQTLAAIKKLVADEVEIGRPLRSEEQNGLNWLYYLLSEDGFRGYRNFEYR